MTQTPNIGLKKIDGSENWRNVFDYHNDSMDLADEAIAGVRAGLTYVEDGDTIAANANYTAGKFICWKGEIYRVKATINATVTSANWTTYLEKMDGVGGALSQINGDLASLNSNLVYLDGSSNAISDANDISKTGIYKAINSTAHKPASAHFIIYHVQFTTEEATQMAIATNNGKLYTRVYYNGAWSTWSEK